jgi:hypothetical protein
MERRRFLSLLTAGVAGIALDQAIPLGRVWSFPSKITLASTLNVGDIVTMTEVWRRVRTSMPERWIVSRKIGHHLYEVVYPGRAPFKVIDSYIEPWPTAVAHPDNRPSPS